MRPKDTAATTSKPAGNDVKRRASGSAEGSGSKAPPGNTTQPIPIRGSRLGVREPLSKPSGTNPSRPGSSGGPVPKSLSYSSWDPNNGKRPIDLNSVESRIVSVPLLLLSFQKTTSGKEPWIMNNDPSIGAFPSALLRSFQCCESTKAGNLLPCPLSYLVPTSADTT